MLKLDSLLLSVPSVGPKTAQLFQKLGLFTVQDLLYHFPFRYEDWSQMSQSDHLPLNEPVTLQVTIDKLSSRRTWKRKLSLVTAQAHDTAGPIQLMWFNQPYLTNYLKKDLSYFVAGLVRQAKQPPVLVNPTIEPASRVNEDYLGAGPGTRHSARIVPVYSTTNGLSVKVIRNALANVFRLLEDIKEPLPMETVKENKLVDLKSALQIIHFPDSLPSLKKARFRLGFDELLTVQLLTKRLKNKLTKAQAPIVELDAAKTKQFLSTWPFTLTVDQKKAAWEIGQDLAKKTPMNRLLQGDVGSGKTAVAALSAWWTAQTKAQTALLAPTELLAKQHYQTFRQLLKDQKIHLALHTASGSWINDQPATPADFQKLLKYGLLQIVIGTHALLSEKVRFDNLALLIVDEQHRFGVKQRQALRDRTPGLIPHFLSLTATPIPRSLALTIYGDLDNSVIKHLPPGRKETVTKLAVTEGEKQAAFDLVREQIKLGRQAFVVCPTITEGEDDFAPQSVEEIYDELKTKVFPELKIKMLHGQLKTDEQQEILSEFYNNQINVLVATTVIEVGMNVPNTSVMLIFSAERFGLATLHQLRGRVGRGHHQSYCIALTNDRSLKVKERLKFFTNTTDGFKLAEYDLKVRGYGQLYGEEQSGFTRLLKIADWSDNRLVTATLKTAKQILKTDPELDQHPLLKTAVQQLQTATHWE